jgi:hypothetical protein
MDSQKQFKISEQYDYVMSIIDEHIEHYSNIDVVTNIDNPIDTLVQNAEKQYAIMVLKELKQKLNE